MVRTHANLIWLTVVLPIVGIAARLPAQEPHNPPAKRPHITIRGVYGGVPQQIFDRGETLEDYGINAIWIGSGSASKKLVADLKARSKGLAVFVEFNTMHEAAYLKDHPDARPIGPDGEASPAPDGWQGVCPTHPGYRFDRMTAFRKVLTDAPIDGIWLDYHHAHANWEQANPVLPDTCFCDRCVSLFERKTKTSLPAGSTTARAKKILESHKPAWVQWRCDVFTDWVREFRQIIEPRPRWRAAGYLPLPVVRDRFRRALCVRSLRSISKPRHSIWTCSPSCPTTPGLVTRTIQPGSRARPPLSDDLSASRVHPANASRSGRSCNFPTGARKSPYPRSRKCSITAPGLRRPA